MLVAPATFNSINKLANGISDTYALGVLAEGIGLGLRVAVIPFVNTALANRSPFRRSLELLRQEGVEIFFERDGFGSHEPGMGESMIEDFPFIDGFNRLVSD